MIQIFGPENRQFYMTPNENGNGFKRIDGAPVLANAATLGDAIRAYEDEHAVLIRPYDGSLEAIPFNTGEEPKYFFYDNSAFVGGLVDIHVLRTGQEICPKQSLSFKLLEGDIVQIGELVC
ncbi:MAG: hypothetical protein AAFN80_16020 [Pseudomonadota bacterium]